MTSPPSRPDGAPGILDLVAALIEAQSAQDDDRMREVLAEDFVYEEGGRNRRVSDREEFLRAWAEWRRVFPDVQGTIDQCFATGSEAVAETSWSGTFEGDLVLEDRTIAATGRRMEGFPVAFVCSAENGRLTQMRLYSDIQSLLRQIESGPES